MCITVTVFFPVCNTLCDQKHPQHLMTSYLPGASEWFPPLWSLAVQLRVRVWALKSFLLNWKSLKRQLTSTGGAVNNRLYIDCETVENTFLCGVILVVLHKKGGSNVYECNYELSGKCWRSWTLIDKQSALSYFSLWILSLWEFVLLKCGCVGEGCFDAQGSGSR